MPDKFDPYREALIVETQTIWPAEYDSLDPRDKKKIADALHADAAQVSQLAYIRQHTGFCRSITVTDDDVSRVKG